MSTIAVVCGSQDRPLLEICLTSTRAALASKIFLAVSPSKLSQAYTTTKASFLIDAKPLHPYHCTHLLQMCMKTRAYHSRQTYPLLLHINQSQPSKINRQFKLGFTKMLGEKSKMPGRGKPTRLKRAVSYAGRQKRKEPITIAPSGAAHHHHLPPTDNRMDMLLLAVGRRSEL